MATKTSSPPRAQAAAAGPMRRTANGRTSKAAAPAKMPAARGTTQRRQDETASVSPPVSVIGMSSFVGLPSERASGLGTEILLQIARRSALPGYAESAAVGRQGGNRLGAMRT